MEADMTQCGKRFKRGFSPIEWGMLLAVLVVFIGYCLWDLPTVIERGRRTSCNSNMKQMGLAFNLYASGNGEARPTNVRDLSKYVGGDTNVRLFMCPTRTRSLPGKAPTRISEFHAAPQFIGYEYLSAASSVPGRVVGATIEPIMCDKAGNHGSDGINILFADGHAAWWSGTIEEYGRSNSLTITINTNWVN
jgi:prepilin-type processing-associated H-X9-DG protein